MVDRRVAARAEPHWFQRLWLMVRNVLSSGLQVVRRPWAVAVAAGLVEILAEIATSAERNVPLEADGIVLLLVGAASIALLRRFPVVTAIVAGLITPLYYVFNAVDSWGGWLTFVVAVFWLAMEGQRVAAVTAVSVSVGAFLTGEVLGPFNIDRILGVLGWILVVFAAGEVARSHRAYLREAQQRAAEAERTREDEARHRATQERLRIAREVHDVLAHQISLINVQAGAALRRRDPEQAYDALGAIKHASKETLRELRSTLGVLRQVDGDEPGGEAVPVAPAPSLARVGELVAQMGEAGVRVRLRVEGAEAALPAPVDLAAYRIVQEALTNAARHAGPATAEVLVRYGADDVTVQVEDDGQGAAGSPAREGNGLRGMRERAFAVSGEFSAGARSERGFRVRAVLPLHSADRS